jgi:hypothetical protein
VRGRSCRWVVLKLIIIASVAIEVAEAGVEPCCPHDMASFPETNPVGYATWAPPKQSRLSAVHAAER